MNNNFSIIEFAIQQDCQAEIQSLNGKIKTLCDVYDNNIAIEPDSQIQLKLELDIKLRAISDNKINLIVVAGGKYTSSGCVAVKKQCQKEMLENDKKRSEAFVIMRDSIRALIQESPLSIDALDQESLARRKEITLTHGDNKTSIINKYHQKLLAEVML